MSEKSKGKARNRRRVDPETPSVPDPEPFRERAAFRVALFSSPRTDVSLWETQAYHEESDTRIVLPGLPGAPLTQWMAALVSGAAETPAVEPHDHPASAVPEPISPPGEADLPLRLDEILANAEPQHEQGPPADFTRIHGIGPVIQERLRSAGIHSYEGFAQLSSEHLAQIVDIAGLPPERVIDWQRQARTIGTSVGLNHPEVDTEVETTFISADEQRTRMEEEATAPHVDLEGGRLPPASSAAQSTHFATGMIEIGLDEDDMVTHATVRWLAGEQDNPMAELPAHHATQAAARFFIEVARDQRREPPMAIDLELGELQVDEVSVNERGTTQPVARLRAEIELAISGLHATRWAAEQHLPYDIYVLAVAREHETTDVVAATRAQIQPDTATYSTSTLLQPLAPGRYRLLAVALIAGSSELTVAVGPKLWVQ